MSELKAQVFNHSLDSLLPVLDSKKLPYHISLNSNGYLAEDGLLVTIQVGCDWEAITASVMSWLRGGGTRSVLVHGHEDSLVALEGFCARGAALLLQSSHQVDFIQHHPEETTTPVIPELPLSDPLHDSHWYTDSRLN